MPGTVETSDFDEIQEQIEQHGGEPAISNESPGEIRVDFGEQTGIEHVSWEEFIEIIEQEGLVMIYEEESIAGSHDLSPSDRYEFVKDKEGSSTDIPDTEMDDDEILGNMEETST